MTDLLTYAADMPHHVATAKAVVPACKQIITQGYSVMSAIIASVLSFAAGAGLGWYVKGRGKQGVQNDINNVKAELEALKAKTTAVNAVIAAPTTPAQ